MELKQAIYNRRSIRIFQDREVEPEKIRQIVNAAQWAPSACNKQGWRFIAVSNQEIKDNIVHMASANRLIGKAPLAIFVLYERHITESKQSHIQSASAGIQNLLLMAHSLGLGATWLTGIGGLDAIAKELKVPDTYQIIACVIVGYPKEQPLPPKRKNIEEILCFNSFNFADNPYPFTYNVKEWPIKQIIKFRQDALRAVSPTENRFSFGKPSETKKEVSFVTKHILENEKVLEIMPFAGSHTVAMLKNKKLQDLHIFELSQQPIEFVEKKLAHNQINLPINACYGKPEALPYQDNYFDTIVVFQKLEMLPDLRIIKELARILKPEGKLLISFKNMFGLYGLYYWYKFRLFNKDPIWNYGPFVPFNYFKIKKILKNNFIIKKEIGITPLIFIGKTIRHPLSFLGRLVMFKATKR